MRTHRPHDGRQTSRPAGLEAARYASITAGVSTINEKEALTTVGARRNHSNRYHMECPHKRTLQISQPPHTDSFGGRISAYLAMSWLRRAVLLRAEPVRAGRRGLCTAAPLQNGRLTRAGAQRVARQETRGTMITDRISDRPSTRSSRLMGGGGHPCISARWVRSSFGPLPYQIMGIKGSGPVLCHPLALQPPPSHFSLVPSANSSRPCSSSSSRNSTRRP